MNDEKFNRIIEQEEKDSKLVNRVSSIAALPFLTGLGLAFSNNDDLSLIGFSCIVLSGIPTYLVAQYTSFRYLYRNHLCGLRKEKKRRGYENV